MTSWLLCDVDFFVDTLRYMLVILVDPYVRSLVGGICTTPFTPTILNHSSTQLTKCDDPTFLRDDALNCFHIAASPPTPLPPPRH